jgi:hypothetical protein
MTDPFKMLPYTPEQRKTLQREITGQVDRLAHLQRHILTNVTTDGDFDPVGRAESRAIRETAFELTQYMTTARPPAIEGAIIATAEAGLRAVAMKGDIVTFKETALALTSLVEHTTRCYLASQLLKKYDPAAPHFDNESPIFYTGEKGDPAKR